MFACPRLSGSSKVRGHPWLLPAWVDCCDLRSEPVKYAAGTRIVEYLRLAAALTLRTEGLVSSLRSSFSKVLNATVRYTSAPYSEVQYSMRGAEPSVCPRVSLLSAFSGHLTPLSRPILADKLLSDPLPIIGF